MTLSRAVARRGRRTQATSSRRRKLWKDWWWWCQATPGSHLPQLLFPPPSPLAILLSAIVRKKPMTMPLSRWRDWHLWFRSDQARGVCQALEGRKARWYKKIQKNETTRRGFWEKRSFEKKKKSVKETIRTTWRRRGQFDESQGMHELFLVQTPSFPSACLKHLRRGLWFYDTFGSAICTSHLVFITSLFFLVALPSWLHVFCKTLCFGCGSSSIITPVLGDDSFLCPVSCVGNPVDHVKRKLTEVLYLCWRYDFYENYTKLMIAI